MQSDRRCAFGAPFIVFCLSENEELRVKNNTLRKEYECGRKIVSYNHARLGKVGFFALLLMHRSEKMAYSKDIVLLKWKCKICL